MAVSLAINRAHRPGHLMPLDGLAIRAASPMLGILLAGGIFLALGGAPPPTLMASLVAAWLAIALALLATARLRRAITLRFGVVGSPGLAQSLAKEVRIAGLQGYEVVGWLDVVGGTDQVTGDPPRLGSVDATLEVAERYALDVVVFGVRESGLEAADPRGVSSISVLEQISAALLGTRVRLIGANQLYEELFGHLPLGTTTGAWFQYVLHPRFRMASATLKRTIDLLVCGLLLLPATLVMAVAALAIKLHDRGPVLYRQRRVGQRRQPLDVLKLRTMRVDAETDGHPRWSAPDDDRVTGVGRVLRRSHLDELPQLWNVMRGEMSLVGPRPERPEFVAELDRTLLYNDRRQLMKPGITGWAQVRIGYAGSDHGAAWKLAHDLYYLKHQSTLLDLMILLETLAAPRHDTRMALRIPDENFVLQAVRDA